MAYTSGFLWMVNRSMFMDTLCVLDLVLTAKFYHIQAYWCMSYNRSVNRFGEVVRREGVCSTAGHAPQAYY